MNKNIETIYFAGGCFWGVQAFVRTLTGVVNTEVGSANGIISNIFNEYDGYAECVKTEFDITKVSVKELMEYFFEIIDPYSVNKQGNDIGAEYRTGVYSTYDSHLEIVKKYIENRNDAHKIVVEVKPLEDYVKSDEKHQDRLDKYPDSYCHIPKVLLNKYK